jgi:hypothetical protein
MTGWDKESLARVEKAFSEAFLNVGKEETEPLSKAPPESETSSARLLKMTSPEEKKPESPISSDESIEIEEVKKRLASGEWEMDL